MNALGVFVPVEILKRHSTGAQNFGYALGNSGCDRLRPIGSRHSGYAPGIHQERSVILIVRQVIGDPSSKFALSLWVPPLIQEAPHQSGKGGVFEEDVGILQPLLAKLREYADF